MKQKTRKALDYFKSVSHETRMTILSVSDKHNKSLPVVVREVMALDKETFYSPFNIAHLMLKGLDKRDIRMYAQAEELEASKAEYYVGDVSFTGAE